MHLFTKFLYSFVFFCLFSFLFYFIFFLDLHHDKRLETSYIQEFKIFSRLKQLQLNTLYIEM
jgi:hypothetical protein